MIKGLYSTCLVLHEEFDANFWRRPSFHNSLHVRLNTQAILSLIDAAETGDDRLGIAKDLNYFVQIFEYEGGGLSQQKFEWLRRSARMAFAMHDLGNILQEIKVSEVLEVREVPKVTRVKGASDVVELMKELGWEFLPNYQAVDAEERNYSLADTLMDYAGVTKFDKKLVDHLIRQTTFLLPDEAPPFGLVVRLCDQFSATFLNTVNVAYSIMREWEAEDSTKLVSLDRQFNFYHWRFEQLLPSKEDREWLIEIWKGTEPKYIEGLPEEKMPVSDAVNWIDIHRPELR